MYRQIDPFITIMPQLDVHGFTEDTVMTVVNEFIIDNYKLRNRSICIIHGKGEGILKRKIHQELRYNKLILRYHLYNKNIGCTIVELKERK